VIVNVIRSEAITGGGPCPFGAPEAPLGGGSPSHP
jgi:hypothetical protein